MGGLGSLSRFGMSGGGGTGSNAANEYLYSTAATLDPWSSASVPPLSLPQTGNGNGNMGGGGCGLGGMGGMGGGMGMGVGAMGGMGGGVGVGVGGWGHSGPS